MSKAQGAKKALGIIETKGLATGVMAADAALKSANVTLIGYELSRGAGYTTIKLEGDVGAVSAAVQSGIAAANQGNGIIGSRVIPRPSEALDMLIRNADTMGYAPEPPEPPAPPTPPAEPAPEPPAPEPEPAPENIVVEEPAIVEETAEPELPAEPVLEEKEEEKAETPKPPSKRSRRGSKSSGKKTTEPSSDET